MTWKRWCLGGRLVWFGVSGFRALGVLGLCGGVPESQAAPVRPISLAVENAVGILRGFELREDGCDDCL